MKTCFISAPVNLDLTVLRSVLRHKGIEAILPFEMEITGSDFRAQIEKAIQRADLFIGVLSGRASNANVYFELGLAWAIGKRVLLIQGRELELPSSLSDFPIVKCKIEDSAQVSFFLDQFLNQQRAPKRHKFELSKTKPLSKRAAELISHLEALGPRASEQEFIKVLGSVFHESGIKVMVQSGPDERGYDLALWFDELENLIGNPVLVNFKKRLTLSAARFVKDDFLRAHDISLGKALLVVFLSGPEKQLARENSGAPLVLFISAARLLDELKSKSIATFIRTERNKLAHGV
jgi:hypothetical protein